VARGILKRGCPLYLFIFYELMEEYMKKIVFAILIAAVFANLSHAESAKERMRRAREQEAMERGESAPAPTATKRSAAPSTQKRKIVNMGTCKDMGRKIAACKPYSCNFPHPQMPFFKVENIVKGKTGPYCLWDQTMIGGVLLECRIPENMLKDYELDYHAAYGKSIDEGKCGVEYVDEENPGSETEQCLNRKCLNCSRSGRSMIWRSDRGCYACDADEDCKEGFVCRDYLCVK
jgi:hypothetical protein